MLVRVFLPCRMPNKLHSVSSTFVVWDIGRNPTSIAGSELWVFIYVICGPALTWR